MAGLRARLPRRLRLPGSFRDLNPYAVGLVSVLVIGAAVGFAFMVGLLHLFEDTYRVRGYFSEAGGIRGGDEVRLAGVKVGRVENIDVDRDRGLVIVKFVVNKGVDLGPETTAEVALETLLGRRYLRLEGKVHQPYLAHVPEDERVIPLERTKVPFDVFKLTRIGTRSIQATDTEKLNAFVKNLADITEGKHDTFAKLFDGLGRVTAAINERDAQLRQLLDRADNLSRTLAEKDRTLVALIDQSQAILDLLARRRADVQAALRGGGAAAAELGRLIHDNKASLDAVLDDVDPALQTLQRKAADVDRTLAWLGPAQLQQAAAGSHGPWGDIYVRNLGPDVLQVIDDALARLLEPVPQEAPR